MAKTKYERGYWPHDMGFDKKFPIIMPTKTDNKFENISETPDITPYWNEHNCDVLRNMVKANSEKFS